MTIVDELRREAEDALKETGMYYDVEYLSTIAKKVEAIVAENDRLEAENARLRTAVATAIRVQTVLCGDMDMPTCMAECPLYRPETDDCVACDVIRVAHELGIEEE